MKSFFSQRSVLILGAILLLGAILRLYHFAPWLHFELDQSRDMLVADLAFEGDALDLPLLGPRAAGSFLRLAPGFYYLQYVSGLIFGADPVGVAFFVPLFSILAIFVFYLLARRGFSRAWSLGLTSVVAVSTYLVLYGRFAWNPNLLVFFIPLGIYALLRAVDTEEHRPGRWFLLAIASLCFATHFHFLAFLSMPLVTGAFLLYKRPCYSWKIWLGALGIVTFLYLPMILNETKAGFTNTKEFFGAITEKQEKSDHNILEKGVRDFTEYALASVVVTTGFEGADFPNIIIQPNEIGSVCRDRCDEGKWYGMAGAFVLILGLLAFVYQAWKAGHQSRRDFYVLALIWFGVSYLIFLPFSYDVAPRFYLLTAPIFFFAVGAIFATLNTLIGKKNAQTLFWIMVISLFTSNLYFTYHRFDELKRAKTEGVESAPDRILKEQIRVTLEQQQAIVNFFKEQQQETGYPIYMHSDPQYRRALKYLMEKEGIQNDILSLSNVYKQGKYFLVLRQRGDYEPSVRKYRENYEVGEYRQFGTLTVIEFTPKADTITEERQVFGEAEKDTTSAAAPRYTWREFFQKNGKSLEDDTEEGEE